MVDRIREKIQNLIGKPISAKEQRCLVSFRDSFSHKISAVKFHMNLIKSIKKQVTEYIDNCHENKKLISAEENMRESIGLSHELEFKYTTLMEDIIYHMMSAIDNLPLIIGTYYQNVDGSISFKSAVNALNHEHTRNLYITKYVNTNWDSWIKKLRDFRGNIYHHHSKICTGNIVAKFGREVGFREEFIINIPKQLRDALDYPQDKEIEIEEFCSDIIKKSFNFFNGLLDIITTEKIKNLKKRLQK